MKDVDRSLYLKRILPFVGNPNAKVITGVRRCGKSTLMRTISEKMDDSVNKIFVNMEEWSYDRFRDPDEFYNMVNSKLIDGKRNCLFIDEVQEIGRWESIIRSLIAERKCDIYLTGSNSRLLSSEYATYLSGRLNILNMNTLTYRECLDFEAERVDHVDNDDVFNRFLRFGGFPILWTSEQETPEAYSTVRDIISTIMLRDIISKHNVRDPDLLMRIFRFLCDNIGKYTSTHNIYTYLNNEDRGVKKDTVYQYTRYLEESYIIQKANVVDVRGKRLLSSKYKYFIADLGLKHSSLGYREADVPGHMENILFMEMKSRGYDVWVGDADGKEIDIVAERFGERVYIQAVYQLSSGDVLKREFGNLNSISDNHPKYVVTMNKEWMNGKQDGIVCCPLQEFLSMESF